MSYTDDRPSPYNLTEEERMDSIRSVALDTGCFVPAHPRTLGAIFAELGLHRYATLDPSDERPRDLADRALIEVGRRVADRCLLRWRSR